MVALTQDRATPLRSGDTYARKVKGGARIFAGSIVALSGGFAVAASTVAALVADGRARSNVDNRDGSDGALIIEVERGTFRYANSAGADEITTADIGKNCFVADDQTVAKTNAANTRPIAGRIEDVEDVGVWVKFG